MSFLNLRFWAIFHSFQRLFEKSQELVHIFKGWIMSHESYSPYLGKIKN